MFCSNGKYTIKKDHFTVAFFQQAQLIFPNYLAFLLVTKWIGDLMFLSTVLPA